MKPRPPFSPFAACARPLPQRAWALHPTTSLSPRPTFATWREAALRSASTATSPKRKPAPVPAKRPSSAATPTAATKTKPAKSPVPAKRPAPPPQPVVRSASSAPLSPAAASPALNPPLSSYAPALDVPAQAPGQGKLKWLYHCGKAYISFYKSGLKNVWATSKTAKSLRARANASPRKSDVLSRAEWQLVRRSRKDTIRLPIFGLLVIVLGEWTALVALYLTPVIPEACRIPKQVERSQRKVEEKRALRFERAARDAARLDTRAAGSGAGDTLDVDVRNFTAADAHAVLGALSSKQNTPRLSPYTLHLLSARFDAHPKILDTLFVSPPAWWLRWRLRRALAYIVKDDALVARDGGWGGLRGEEVVRACVERGVDVRGRAEGELRKVLGAWGRV